MPSGVYLRTQEMKTGKYIRTPEMCKNIGLAKIGHIPWNKGKPHLVGDKHWNWKGGISKDKIYKLKYKKEYRHRIGESKKYSSEYSGICISKTKEYKKLQRQKRRALVKGGGELTIKTIQLVYEDNIKKYGTLTCIYCLKPIEFGKDTLEHKQPLSRGGTNLYENLAIACQKCNSSKNDKTEEEFRKEIL